MKAGRGNPSRHGALFGGKAVDFKTLEGRTLRSVTRDETNETVDFVTVEGECFRLHHSQDCCECVVVEDVCGDLNDLVGTPILLAEESMSDTAPSGSEARDDCDQWTFYKLRTIKGSVDIRWHGSSNGYYSVGVDFDRIDA